MVDQPEGARQIYLVDASIAIFRYYFSLPEHWVSEPGYPTQAVYGYVHWLKKLIQKRRPEMIAACFDESLGSCFRNDIYDLYKCSRPLPDEALAFQLEACKQVTQLMGVHCFASDRYEADDLLGTWANIGRLADVPSVIVSRDKDLGQLLCEGDWLWNFPDDTPLNCNGVQQRFGVLPVQIPDYLALVGDSIDDIPGVPGVGPKTAVALLERFPSVELLLANLQEISSFPFRGAKQLASKIEPFAEQIVMAKSLATICRDAPLGESYTSIEDLTILEPDNDALVEYCRWLGFAFKPLL